MNRILILAFAVMSTNAFAQLNLSSEHYLLGETNWLIHGKLEKPNFSTDLIHWEPNFQTSTIIKTLHRLQKDPASGQACVVVRRDVFTISNCNAAKQRCSVVIERNGVAIESTEVGFGINAFDWGGPYFYYRNSIYDNPVIGRNRITVWKNGLGQTEFSEFAEWPNPNTYDHLETFPKAISKAMYEALLPFALPTCSSEF